MVLLPLWAFSFYLQLEIDPALFASPGGLAFSALAGVGSVGWCLGEPFCKEILD